MNRYACPMVAIMTDSPFNLILNDALNRVVESDVRSRCITWQNIQVKCGASSLLPEKEHGAYVFCPVTLQASEIIRLLLDVGRQLTRFWQKGRGHGTVASVAANDERLMRAGEGRPTRSRP